MDDPSDGPAVYGALHSSFFGFSDDELFLFWAAGGRFDLFAAQPEAHAAVGAALATLRELHERRAAGEPHELAADLVRLARASEFLAATGPGGAQAIANLEKLVDRARAFSGARRAAASGRSSSGRRKPVTPPENRNHRWTTTGTSCTCSRSTRRRAWSTRS